MQTLLNPIGTGLSIANDLCHLGDKQSRDSLAGTAGELAGGALGSALGGPIGGAIGSAIGKEVAHTASSVTNNVASAMTKNSAISF